MARRVSLAQLDARILACRRCPRLIAHCRKVAAEKRAAYRDETYHGRPVPNFGDPAARVLIVGLAPGAHGANRTGRMFTGDRSGDFLCRALHEAGLASQPDSVRVGDGLALRQALVTAACHCAPPGNKPTPAELANCAPWLSQTFDALPDLRVVVCLGKLAFDAVLRECRRRGWIDRTSAYRFAHGAAHRFDARPSLGRALGAERQAADAPVIVCSYHPSQQNTFTGRLTRQMLRRVLAQAAALDQE